MDEGNIKVNSGQVFSVKTRGEKLMDFISKQIQSATKVVETHTTKAPCGGCSQAKPVETKKKD